MSSIIQMTVESNCARISIHNPPVNALNRAAFEALYECIKEAEKDPNVRVVVIVGSGKKSFVAGIDVKEVAQYDARQMAEFNCISGRALRAIEQCTKPVVCVVSGIAYGAGFELALACDFRLAAQNAVFALPELSLGIIPGGGGTQRLTRCVGPAKAKEIVMLGRPLPAEEAKALGVACDVVEPEKLEEATTNLVNELIQRPLIALAEAKLAIANALDVPIEAGLSLEQRAFMTAFQSRDGQEGIRAFVEKRKPVFSNV
ncbi:enoyl-CoA hydratase/isomerase family protein [Alicyclobacillus acidocaldarius]|uniref:Enoyl-CoA hydratase/isomerase n=1 Tax=Alicyclobacillus acidocaldarius (strain Tc-4-1) TaxID=1048834 RepID=F8ICT6_ALIAT|nr:enoyl-CoA hydratase-related protein [Alicyclobacillus acidocaldarius]AEJ43751.1 Enoyl-CoA hydratase/isomerase [Alicyclobacillus acidocaldarius subsp. acidocaldarius Tc-4-1]